jgi:hypothetical protein
MSNQTEAPARRPGRPSHFPDRETVQFGASIPVETRDAIRQIAADRDEPINVTLDRIVSTAFKQHAARRNRQGSKRKAAKANAEQSND